MASRCICLYPLRNQNYSSRLKVQQRLSPQARSQSFRDEGNSSNTVDANMSILKYRMEQVRMKERANTCYGWNYRYSGYDDVLKKRKMLLMSIQMLYTIGTTIGMVFLSGTLSILLVSFIFSSWKN